MGETVVLLPTYNQAVAYRKRCARANAGFGVKATTPAAWLRDAWELFGDGTTVIGSLDRSFAVQSLLARHTDDLDIPTSAGTVSLIAQFFADAVGTAELASAVAAPPASLTDVERSIVALSEEYRALLAERNLIEAGDALAQLAAAERVPTFEMPYPLDLPRSFERILPARTEAASITPLPDGVEPCFLFAAGPSAQNALLADHVLESLSGPDACRSIAVICAKPLETYRALVAPLSAADVFCEVHARRLFCQTEFGRAYTAVTAFLQGEGSANAAFADYAASPFSGVDELQAARIDAMIRGDRLVSFEELRALGHLVSPHFDSFEELAFDADASLLLDYFVDVAAELPGKDVAFRTEQVSAVSGLRRVYEAARIWGTRPVDFAFALDKLTVDASRGCGSGPARVVICGLGDSANLDEERFDEVVVCDLDARFVTSSEEHTSLVTLEEKIGLAHPVRALDAARRSFEQAKAHAGRVFACQRVMSAGGEEDIYAAFTLEEFIACCDPDDDLDRFGLPASLRPFAHVRGEELFSANANPGVDPTDPIELPPARSATLSSLPLQVLHTRTVQTAGGEKLVLSPSAIEAYLNCPYGWFVSRRLRPEAPDEQVGPLEQGTFVHAVFESFYNRLASQSDRRRVALDTLAEDRVLFEQVFDECLQAQPDLDSTRYVPATPTERAEAERLKQRLSANLALQARLMPSFAPVEHEHVIAPEDGIDYAGVRLNGRIDRIDVDQASGHYAVIDYKGSITGHDAGFDPDADEPFALPHKVQALIYAQALRTAMDGVRPVGALYLNYRADKPARLIAGSFDAFQLDVSLFASAKSKVAMNFGSFLDQVEEEIAARLEGMHRGVIDPNPLCAASCRYCPVVDCERRLS